MDKPIKLNLGGGRQVKHDHINIDCIPFVDGKGKQVVDVIIDIEKERLPYYDETVDEILAENILEHVGNLRFVMNECHRVLKKDGVLWGMVPMAGTEYDFKDPTHKRHFTLSTFSYFTGQSPAKVSRPKHPKYADYGFYPWNQISLELEQDGMLIAFRLEPRKIKVDEMLSVDKEYHAKK